MMTMASYFKMQQQYWRKIIYCDVNLSKFVKLLKCFVSFRICLSCKYTVLGFCPLSSQIGHNGTKFFFQSSKISWHMIFGLFQLPHNCFLIMLCLFIFIKQAKLTRLMMSFWFVYFKEAISMFKFSASSCIHWIIWMMSRGRSIRLTLEGIFASFFRLLSLRWSSILQI